MNKKKMIGLVATVVAVLVVIGVILYTRTPPNQFTIVSHNGVLGFESFYPEIRYNYTVFVEVKHVTGDKNMVTVYCELTREDLTTITKQQAITLSVGQSKILQFFFSNGDLRGKIPNQYKAYLGGT